MVVFLPFIRRLINLSLSLSINVCLFFYQSDYLSLFSMWLYPQSKAYQHSCSNTHTHTHTHTHFYQFRSIHIKTFKCVCVCVCVCVCIYIYILYVSLSFSGTHTHIHTYIYILGTIKIHLPAKILNLFLELD